MSHILKSMVSLAGHLMVPTRDKRRSSGQDGLTLEDLEGRKLMSAGIHGHRHVMHTHAVHALSAQTSAVTTAASAPTTSAADTATTTSGSTTTTTTANPSGPMSGRGFDQMDGGPMIGNLLGLPGGGGVGGGGPMMGGGFGGGGGGHHGRHGGQGGFGNFGGPTGANSSSDSTATTTPTKLQADFTKLNTDTQAIRDKSQVTPAMMAKVRQDWKAITTANPSLDLKTLLTPPTPTSTTTPTAPPTFDQQITTLKTALAGASVSQSLIDPLVTDLTAVNTASNVTADDLSTVQADHATIKADAPAPTTPTDGYGPGGFGGSDGMRGGQGGPSGPAGHRIMWG